VNLERLPAGSQKSQHWGVVVQHVTRQHAQMPLCGFAKEAAQQEPPQPDVLIGIIHDERQLGLFGTIAMKAAHRYDGRVFRGIRHGDQCHPLDLVDCRQPLSFEWITPHDRVQKAAPYGARRQPFAQVHEPRGIFRQQRAQPHEPSISKAKSTCDRICGVSDSIVGSGQVR
jgi:hypothetical protein